MRGVQRNARHLYLRPEFLPWILRQYGRGAAGIDSGMKSVGCDVGIGLGGSVYAGLVFL